MPRKPDAWLYQAAKRKAIDRLRRVATQHAKANSLTYQTELAHMDDDEDINIHTVPDERLRLIFTCCHPALPAPAHTALTLKTICGLSTAQIASAYLVTETSMVQRIVRAKRKIKQAGIPFVLPGPDLWPERWASVLAVIYLIFNEGYSRLTAQIDLCVEAIRLGRVLVKLLPQEPEAADLLALMLLSHARRPARMAKQDVYIAMEHQDRSLWYKNEIYEAQDLLVKTLSKGKLGPYQIQAAISAVHCQAENFADTDWHEISALYERLYTYEPTPVVLLNASVALSYAQNPAVGLASLQLISQGGNLKNYQPYYAAWANMLKRDGQYKRARQAYVKAISLSTSPQETSFLSNQMARMD